MPPPRLLSALYPKVTVLFNINLALPSYQTRHIQWEGEQLFNFFLFEKALWVLQCCQLCGFKSAHVQIFKIFSYFCLWKNRSKMSVYIIWTSMRNFSWNFLTFFRKPHPVYIFINCINLWKFVLIVFNTDLNFIKWSYTSTIFRKESIKFE